MTFNDRDDYYRVLNGEMPEYLPKTAWALVCPSVLRQNRQGMGAGFDCFGVEYVISESAMNGAIPKPGQFMIDDITKWRDIVKLPDLSGVDWEMMAKKDLEKIDRSQKVVMSDCITGFFQGLINFMGFTEGLCACYEEPEEVKAMMQWFLDFHMEVGKKYIKYYKPDSMWMPDDVCTERSPFVSPEMFRELFKPYWKQYVELFRNAGLPAQLHCCGQCMPIIDDFVDVGFTAWDPAQRMNDLKAIKAKYGRKLAFVGGFETRGFISDQSTTEEQVRQYTRDVIDELAPDGGFVFSAMVASSAAVPDARERSRWIQEEYESYGRNYYKTH